MIALVHRAPKALASVALTIHLVLAAGCSSPSSSAGPPDAAACATATDCPSKALPVCAAGVCVECNSDDACTDMARPSCDRAKHVCVAACKSGSDCGSAMYPLCDDAAGDCVACLKDGDCKSAGLRCDSGACVARCQSGADCKDPAAPVCSATDGACVECMSDTDCKAPTPTCTDGHTCDATPKCHQCACVDLASMGGCADRCAMGTNGTHTPNFCDGVNALSQCRQCLQDHCPDAVPSDPSSCL